MSASPCPPSLRFCLVSSNGPFCFVYVRFSQYGLHKAIPETPFGFIVPPLYTHSTVGSITQQLLIYGKAINRWLPPALTLNIHHEEISSFYILMHEAHCSRHQEPSSELTGKPSYSRCSQVNVSLFDALLGISGILIILDAQQVSLFGPIILHLTFKRESLFILLLSFIRIKGTKFVDNSLVFLCSWQVGSHSKSQLHSCIFPQEWEHRKNPKKIKSKLRL